MISIDRVGFSCLTVVILGQLFAPARAQDFAGRFLMNGTDGTAVLTFAGQDGGVYQGTLANQEYEVPLAGMVIDGVLQGAVADETGSIIFAAELRGAVLTLTLAEVDVFGNPVPATAQVLVFSREGALAEAGPAAVTATDGAVTINGLGLSAEQLAEIATLYGVAPLPGDYWYDRHSGLYGAVGYQAFGFMLPGHEYGPLVRDVSRGDTGVLVNGRELPQSEWLIWSYMLGAPIQIGAYWLDEQGNAGYEGSAVPLVNLYVAAQQNAYAGEGGGGDNFWSTRFSAGNFDSGNTRGYVSVPGHGPVGYGF